MLKKLFVIVFCSSLAWGGFAAFAADDAAVIKSNMEKLRASMLKPDAAKLNALLEDKLMSIRMDVHKFIFQKRIEFGSIWLKHRCA